MFSVYKIMDLLYSFIFVEPTGAMADYANLHRVILQTILKYLSFLECVRFGAVCSHWFEVVKERNYFPWLLFYDIDFPMLYNILEKTVYQIEIPELHGRHCVGFSHGWLITINSILDINLLNPFSKAQVNLPLLPFYWSVNCTDIIIYKAVISSDPSKSFNYAVAAIFNCNYNLGFWKPGDREWTMINSKFMLEDIIWYNGAFYVVGKNSQVCRVEFDMNNELKEIATQDKNNLHKKKMYMVDFMGDLLLIYRMTYPIGYNVINTTEFHRTKCFMLFKLVSEENQFVELENINDHVLFLGSNYAMLIPTTTMEDKIKSNMIYFCDDNIYENRVGGYSDSGSYNIRDGSITPFLLHNIRQQVGRPIFMHFDLCL
ncbi:putative F-box-like domain superfamily protein [Dioscorea sansibarensis]